MQSLKTLAVAAFSLFATFAHAQQKKSNGSELPIKYHVSGTLAGFKSKYIYFEAMGIQSTMVFDSTKNVNGKFDFTGSASEPGLFRVRAGKDFNAAVLLALTSKQNNVTVEADSVSMTNFTYKTHGSPATEQMRKLMVEAMSRYGKMNQLSQQLQQANLTEAQQQQLKTELETNAGNSKKYFYGYTDTVTNPVVAIFAALSFMSPDEDLLQMKRVRKNLRQRGDTTFGLAKQFVEHVSSLSDKLETQLPVDKFQVGDTLPNIALKDTSGNVVSLRSLRGKYVLVDFWASWCGPCRMENPNVVAAYNKYKDKGFTIYSVSLDNDKTKWINAIKHDRLAWQTHVSELKGWNSGVCGQFGVNAIPTNFLIDPQGKLVGSSLRGEELDNRLAQIFK